MPDHPIFDDILMGDLEAVKRRVLADATALDEKDEDDAQTPLIYAVWCEKLAIAHWIIEHRGEHGLDASDADGDTALHWASSKGPLSLVQALIREGANPSPLDARGCTPLMYASSLGHSDIVACLQLPCVRASIDHVSNDGWSAVSSASRFGPSATVQLLLDAGADPTIPAGDESPLNEALRFGRTATAALLRHAIAEPDRPHALHKARSLLDATIAIAKARSGSTDGDDKQQQQQQRRRMRTRGQRKQQVIATAPVYLKGRVQQDAPVPMVELTPPPPPQQQQQQQQQQGDDDEQLQATAAFVVGLEEGGVQYQGLPRELLKELLEYMIHAWADKGPEAEEEEEEDFESEDDESEDLDQYLA